ncbi:nuclease-related domain-containing protein [Neobacillus drentensis]|uniref:nuclease-related domain-containing protein n=1 Tax=Neobacillus drentensis TaxID=220684 RepID=UPI002FFFDB0E
MKRRLRIRHIKHPEIEKDLAKRWAGYWGEIALAHYVKELPQEKYYIFHNLHLQHNGVHFQIDTLLITQYYILIIEAKNINVTLLFDNVFKQLIRINDDGTEESFEDPRVQCQRLQYLLGGWHVKNGLNLFPMNYLIFLKSVKTILKADRDDKVDFSKICKGRDFFNKIESQDNRYHQIRVDKETINRLVELLVSQHCPKQINILAEYNISKEDIRSGVHCSNCFYIPMIYKKGKWFCPTCHMSSKDALIVGLNDYFYLIQPCVSSSKF